MFINLTTKKGIPVVVNLDTIVYLKPSDAYKEAKTHLVLNNDDYTDLFVREDLDTIKTVLQTISPTEEKKEETADSQ